jgi:hypothetical protein
MRIGFLLLRDTFLKTMGSLITESIKDGHHVVLLCERQTPLGAKEYQRVTDAKVAPLKAIGAEIVSFSLEKIPDLKLLYGLDALVTHEGYYFLKEYLEQLQAARRTGVIVVSLAHFFENTRLPLNSINYFDQTFYISKFAVDTHVGAKDAARRLSGAYAIAGSPMLDQIGLADKGEVKKRLGIPSEKRVVVFFAPEITKETRWRHYIWGESKRLKRIWRILGEGQWGYFFDGLFAPTMQEMASALKEFCTKNNGWLVVKSRLKQAKIPELEAQADLFLGGDDQYYPIFVGYELLSIADLSIAVMSMAVPESVAAGVPVVNIAIPFREYQFARQSSTAEERRYFERTMNLNKPSPFNFSGAVINVKPTKLVSWLQRKSLSDISFDSNARKEYVDYFLGVGKESSSARILRSLTALVNRV